MPERPARAAFSLGQAQAQEAADLIVRQGGTVVLGETSEVYGGEHLLTRRAVSEEVGQKLVDKIHWWEEYTSMWGAEIDNNPSPGNKLGGLTTIYEKSLGAIAKAGTTPMVDVIDYAEGEYFHDVDSGCNLRQVNASRANSKPGREWQELRQKYIRVGHLSGPMHYPTHSTSGPVCVMNAHAVEVTAYGYRNRTNDPFFADSAFSNEMALFRMSNGATVRICEMRETPGCPGHESETFRVFGTLGSFSENRWWSIKRPDFANIDLEALPKPEYRALKEQEMFDPLPPEVELAFKQAYNPEKSMDELRESDFHPWGHGGSHPYLAHEFVSAVRDNRIPAINIWESVRYMAMGIAAHRSALKDGETLPVPDWGDAPSA